MIDRFSLTQMLCVLHAHIYLFNEDGTLDTAFEEDNNIKEEECRAILPNARKDFPYLDIGENGVVMCAMWAEAEQKYVVLSKICIYGSFGKGQEYVPYCSKDKYASIILLIWKQLTGQEIYRTELWKNNIKDEFELAEVLTEEIFKYHEEGVSHNPYVQELREHDSIRRGDVLSLKESINEVYTGSVGRLASDPIRSMKNAAIYVVGAAARCAIEGGLNPEIAFVMCDTYIRHIEDNLNDIIKIESAVREAEFNFAQEVHDLKNKAESSPLMMQVKDYVFKHIHDAILIRDIAKYVGVSPNYLSEQFSHVEGITLKQYIIDEKIKSSEYLLKYSDYSLQEISSFCAFSSQSRFSVYFQRKNGITPARYRKRFQKNRNE